MLQTLLRSLLTAGLLLQSLVAPARAGNINLPDLGDESAAVISPAQERKLGEDFMRQARQSLAFLDDPEINDYIQTLGLKLVSHSDATQKEFRFFVINDPTINAFAVPGGFVGVHTGLILAAQSEAELASVLAHETTHVTQRHIPRLIAESQRLNTQALAAVLASILLASSGQGQGAEAGIALTSAAVTQKGLNYSRALEEEADRLGMGILAGAGFDPHAMPAFFEHMQNLNRLNESNLPEFLRTHPVTTNRIADARNRAEQITYRQAPESSEFHHVRAKLRALAADNPAEIARAFKENLAQGKYRDADAERYGYALALLRSRQFAEARDEGRKLAERRPNRNAYRVLQAEIEMAAGKTDEAVAVYASAYKKAPNDPVLRRAYAEALLKTGQAREASVLVKAAIRQQPDDPALYKMLAQAAGDAGVPLEAHQAMAEHYYLNGNPKAALDQLQLAVRLAGDNFYLQSSLEARIVAIKEEMTPSQGKKQGKK